MREGLTRLFRSTGVLAMLMAAPFGGASAQDATLKMNTVEFCPETPYERWYPFSEATMYNEGEMTITKDTISYTKHGSFHYTVHTVLDKFSVMQVDDMPEEAKLGAFMYLQFSKSPYTHSNQSCMIEVFDCTTLEGIEYMVRSENNLPTGSDDNVYCSISAYVRDTDRRKMRYLIPADDLGAPKK